jgi:hypothetical protein
MPSFEKSPRKFEYQNRLPRRRFSRPWIIMGAVTLANLLTTGYIFEYRPMTSYEAPEQSANARDLPPERTANANPAPVAPTATPKS